MNWNIHPGEILREEFMLPNHLSSRKLALLLEVPASKINDIVLKRRGTTADTDIRLSKFFKTTVRFWLNSQVSFELKSVENVNKQKQEQAL
jgi:addiction module HigA family antidote